jgi:ribonuclease VapC
VKLGEMNEVLLDSSAILAILDREPGAERLRLDVLKNAIASAVNLAEVQTVLVNRGIPADEAWRDARSPIRETVAFDDDQARLAGSLAIETRTFGLSLGDRACLGLGLRLRIPVYTADRAWKKLKMNVELRFLR